MSPEKYRHYPKMREFTVFFTLECGHKDTCEGWPGNEMLCKDCGQMRVVTSAMEVPPWTEAL